MAATLERVSEFHRDMISQHKKTLSAGTQKASGKAFLEASIAFHEERLRITEEALKNGFVICENCYFKQIKQG